MLFRSGTEKNLQSASALLSGLLQKGFGRWALIGRLVHALQSIPKLSFPHGIQGKVELEHIDMKFADHAE